MVYHVLAGVYHLHSNLLFHRDLKSLNILVTCNNECKLTDFGMSKLVKDEDSFLHTANKGSPLWMAPEVKSGNYSFPSDIYSLGLVIYEIIERKLPGWDKRACCIVLPDVYAAKEIVKPLTEKDPLARLKAKEAIGLYHEKYLKTSVEKIKNSYPELSNLTGDPIVILQQFKETLKDKDLEFIFG